MLITLISALIFSQILIAFPPTSKSAFIQSCLDSTFPKYQSKLTVPAKISTTGLPLTFTLGPFLMQQCAIGQLKTIQINTTALNSSFQFASDGSLAPTKFVDNEDLQGQNFSNKEFCVASDVGGNVNISICLIDCGVVPCIPKCCHTHELYNVNSSSCVPAKRLWIPKLHAHDKEGHPRVEGSVHVVEKMKHCNEDVAQVTKNQHYVFSKDGHTEFRLLANGQLMFKTNLDVSWEVYPFEDFCMDGDSNSDENVIVDLDCLETPTFPVESNDTSTINDRVDRVVVKTNNKNDKFYDKFMHRAELKNTLNLVHASLMVISSIFLLFAIVIYIALWEKQNTHGWTVLSYIASLFFAYIFLAIYKFLAGSRGSSGEKSGLGCILNGILAHFFFESIFTWLTVINFDIWWKFWDMKAHPIKAKELGRYLAYASFGFGIPLLIIIIALILGEKGNGISIESVWNPGYGEDSMCFLQPRALGVYLYYPVGILMILNFGFFVSTSFKIYSHFKNASHVHEEKAQQEFESCKVIVKLFVVMGVTWVFELVSYLAEDERSSDGWVILWGILDCANILQALGIFYVFIWKRLILTQLWQTYPSLRPILRMLKGMPGCKKRIDYRSSSRLTTKSKKVETASQKLERQDRPRKLSDSEQTTSFEQIEL